MPTRARLMPWANFLAKRCIAAFAFAFAVVAEFSHAALPEIDLAMHPLSGSVNIHPNVLLSLSIDQSASRAAYLDGHERYDRDREYLGYFNPRKCYAYQGGNRNVVSGYFYSVRDADALHECSQAFSGNFMNWASASMLDMLRYALTGGDRVADTTQSTVLQRAVLANGAYADPQYFPRKVLKFQANASAPNRVTPFNANTLFIVSCRNRILFSDVQGSANECDTPAYDGQGRLAATDKRLGEYLARVQVCDRQEGAQRIDLCQAYGKSFKPVGLIQRYAQTLRFAVMGYLLDPSERRYGGVLRSAMHDAGDRRVLPPGFLAEDNPHAEWDPATGILYEDPGVAGAVNYLNRFGRSGEYTRFDPIGELYYEGLRYLQGKPATPAAMENIRAEMKDGLPVLAFDDPVTAACQKNYLVAIGDANTHWDRYLPGNQRTAFNGLQPAFDAARPVEPAIATKWPSLDVPAWTAKVGAMEADASGRYGNPAPRAALANLHMLDTGAGGHGSYYMAGLAYWANTQDIRLDKPVRSRTLVVDFDDGGNGSLNGGKRIVKPQDSQLFLAAKYGGFRDANGDGNPFVTYDADGKTLVRFNTLEWDPDKSGMPETYLLASDPAQWLARIRRMFAMLANDGTDAFPEVARHHVLDTSATSGADGKFLYQAGFRRIGWSGSLKKFPLVTDQLGNAQVSAKPMWEAGMLLSGTDRASPSPAPHERRIYTAVAEPGRSIRTVPFTWQALSPAQRMALSALPGYVENDELGERRLDYLRGVRTEEIGRSDGIFRARRSVLGDIVNSNPVLVGAPVALSPDQDYAEFHARHSRRAKAIYVGANDGMLHAFDADSGVELFAYIPNALMPALPSLTHPEYLHRPYVDGGIATADAKVAGRWKTVLAAGMGGGAQGVFALDISDPARFGEESGVLWEFTDSDDPDIGNVLGKPQIAKFRVKSDSAAAGYFVVVPSGLNNYRPDGAGRFSSNGQAALFLLSLEKDPATPWKLGVNYYKIKLPVGEPGLPNGLSVPVLAGGANGVVRTAYAGDLQGNLWRFDFADDAPSGKALGAGSKPLFVARDEAGRRQPIAVQPRLVYGPGGGYMVLFGTGKFFEAQDAAPGGFRTQSFYGLLDRPGVRKAIDGRQALSRRRLMMGADGSISLPAPPAPEILLRAGDTQGWFFDFPDSEKTGERVMSDSVTVFGRLFFSTWLPSPNPCRQDGARMYVMDALTGLPIAGAAMGYALEPGSAASPLVLTETLDIVGSKAGGRQKVKKRHVLLDPNGRDSAAGKQPSLGRGDVALPAGRLSWREVTNWQEMRDEALKK